VVEAVPMGGRDNVEAVQPELHLRDISEQVGSGTSRLCSSCSGLVFRNLLQICALQSLSGFSAIFFSQSLLCPGLLGKVLA